MSFRILFPLSFSALLAFSACSEDPTTTRETDNATADEDEDPPAETEDEDTAAKPDASRPRLDASRPDTGTTPPPVDEPEDVDDAGSKPPTSTPDGGADASKPPPSGGGTGECCDDGDCLCHGDAPNALTSANGPYKTASYSVPAGCIHYPTDAEPPFAAVTVSDGFGGSGGCGFSQTGNWGPLYASWGIVTMIVNTTGGDQPNTRGMKLLTGVAAFKTENEKSGSPLEGKLAGRYGTSGFSMGGGGTSYASRDGDGLKSSVAIMPWGPVRSGVDVPTLVICGSSDTIASCASHGNGLYAGISNDVPKMRVTVSSGHAGQPSAGGGKSGQLGLAFQKVYLEGDTRWRPLLVGAMANETNIK